MVREKKKKKTSPHLDKHRVAEPGISDGAGPDGQLLRGGQAADEGAPEGAQGQRVLLFGKAPHHEALLRGLADGALLRRGLQQGAKGDAPARLAAPVPVVHLRKVLQPAVAQHQHTRVHGQAKVRCVLLASIGLPGKQ